jgi:hypothetical protein
LGHEKSNEGTAMSDLTREQRLQIMLTEEELATIDDWRFARRMPTRAAAVRELLKRGLAAEGFSSAMAGEKSQDFGVVGEQAKRRAGDGADADGSL